LFTALPFSTAVEERLGLALLFELRGPREPPPAVAVVSIDAVASEALAQPQHPSQWQRSLHAQLVDRLASAEARVIAFDLFFIRPGAAPDADALLAQSLRRAGNVVLMDLLEPLGTDAEANTFERLVPPLPLFSAAAAAHAPFPLPKHDSVRGWWLQRPPGRSTLPVEVARLFSDAAVPTDPAEQARYIDFYGPPRTIPTLGFHDVLSNGGSDAKADTEALRHQIAGRAVFVGYATATPEGQDRIRDSFDTVYTQADGVALSGVEIAATAFANLLEGRWPRPLSLAAQAGVWLAWGLLLGALCAVLPTLQALPAVALAAAAYLGVAHLRFVADAQWLPITAPLLVQVPVALFGGALWHWLREHRLRGRYGALIDDLLPRQIVARATSPLQPGAVADEQQVYGVVVMTDVAGFTTMAESLEPTVVTRRLNEYLALIFPAIERHGGSVCEINGDAMLAFWLAPGREDEAARLSACVAALEIEQLTAAGASPAGLPTRIGVHAGPITLARIGASLHHEYRVVGDAANTASRLESLSKHLGTRLLASEEVVGGIDRLLTRPLGEYVLAGKSAPVRVHEIVALSASATDAQRERCALFGQGLAAFRARRWKAAAASWQSLLSRWPDDRPSCYFLTLTLQNAIVEPAPRMGRRHSPGREITKRRS
jgi:adenylate cyclase